MDLLRKALAFQADEASTRRILDAALAQFEDFGLRRSTMDDVARRSGLSRITIYRRFPKKDLLVEAVILRELRRLMDGIDDAVASVSGIEKVVESVAFTMRFLRGHQLLNRLLRTEPEVIVPYLTVQGGLVIDLAREHGATLIRQELFGDRTPPPDVERRIQAVSEMGVRLTLSFVLTRDSVIPLDTPDDARAYAREHIAPLYRVFR